MPRIPPTQANATPETEKLMEKKVAFMPLPETGGEFQIEKNAEKSKGSQNCKRAAKLYTRADIFNVHNCFWHTMK